MSYRIDPPPASRHGFVNTRMWRLFAATDLGFMRKVLVMVRRLSLQFRALLRSHTPEGLSPWIADAKKFGIYALQRFAKTLRRDEAAVRNAIADPWSSGQVEGRINRLKTLETHHVWPRQPRTLTGPNVAVAPTLTLSLL
jgi:hypothetical protein